MLCPGGQGGAKGIVISQKIIGGYLEKIGQREKNEKGRLGAAVFIVGDGRWAKVEPLGQLLLGKAMAQTQQAKPGGKEAGGHNITSFY